MMRIQQDKNKSQPDFPPLIFSYNSCEAAPFYYLVKGPWVFLECQQILKNVRWNEPTDTLL